MTKNMIYLLFKDGEEVEVKEKVAAVENVKSVDLELTFEPSWNKDMMSEEAKFELGML